MAMFRTCPQCGENLDFCEKHVCAPEQKKEIVAKKKEPAPPAFNRHNAEMIAAREDAMARIRALALGIKN